MPANEARLESPAGMITDHLGLVCPGMKWQRGDTGSRSGYRFIRFSGIQFGSSSISGSAAAGVGGLWVSGLHFGVQAVEVETAQWEYS